MASKALSDWNLGPPPQPKPPIERVLYKEREAAAVLNCSQRTVRNLADRGELPRVRFLASVRYDRADLLAFIERSKSRSTSTQAPKAREQAQ